MPNPTSMNVRGVKVDENVSNLPARTSKPGVLMPLFGGNVMPEYWSSIPLETEEQRLAFIPFFDLRKHDADKFKEGIPIVDLVRCEYSFLNENGVVNKQPRYLACDDKGNWYNLFGGGIVGDIDRLCSNISRPHWSPPMVFNLWEDESYKPSPLKRMRFKRANAS